MASGSYSETGLEDAEVKYVRVPDFTGRTFSEAKAWAVANKINIQVTGDATSETIVSQSRTTPKALKAGNYAETLVVTTGGKKDNTMMYAALALLALLLISKK